MQWWRDLKCFFLQCEPGLNVWHGRKYDHAVCRYCGRAIHRHRTAVRGNSTRTPQTSTDVEMP